MQLGDANQSHACKAATLPFAIEVCILQLSTKLDMLDILTFFKAKVATNQPILMQLVFFSN
jgi:hypothetical protein